MHGGEPIGEYCLSSSMQDATCQRLADIQFPTPLNRFQARRSVGELLATFT
jgi:hypothetical protein